MSQFRTIDESLIQALKNVCTSGSVSDASDILAKYSTDETTQNTQGKSARPDLVVCPRTRDEVSEILKICQVEKIPVTPRGAGTGVTGGALAIHGGIVLSCEYLNRILEIDCDNLMITVEPGVITEDLRNAVAEKGLFYPPDPSSMHTCSIGGNLAEGAGGPNAVKYGVTKDYVCGLEVVYPDGSIGRLGGKFVKNVTGYDLVSLLIGSEGTLGIFTQIILRLLPLPQYSRSLLMSFMTHDQASKAVSSIIRSKIIPAAIEFLDIQCIRAVEQYLNERFRLSQGQAFLLVRLDGYHEEILHAEMTCIKNIVKEYGAKDVLCAATEEEQEHLWRFRRNIRPALKILSPEKISEDIVVPRSRIPECISRVNALSAKYKMNIFCYGHAGDGNVHVQILKRSISDEQWQNITPDVIKEVFQIALDLGGTITAEHGIGTTKKDYLSMALDAKTIAVMKSIKQQLDPNNILNPGKIFSQ